MLTLTSAFFAKTEELLRYKDNGFKLKSFPGYTFDQWGIKAHNRPWVEEVGKFKKNEKIIEVGGAYSTFPRYLNEKYGVEAWIGDDFGGRSGEKFWKRWGDPKIQKKANPNIKYVFEPFGIFSKKYPNNYFDKIFSISTLEHIDKRTITDVLKDMNRCTKVGGKQFHTIDIFLNNPIECFKYAIYDRVPILRKINKIFKSEITKWRDIFETSGIKINVPMPSPIEILDKSTLVESPDVVYRFYPPNNKCKKYTPNSSLLLIIEDI